MADANTGNAGLIRIDVSESNLNADTNNSTVNWAFYLIENTASNQTFSSGRSASVDWAGVAVLWSGTFSFDWRAAGLQTTLIASGSFSPGRNPDGSGSVTIQGNMGSTGTSGAGGPTSVSQGYNLAKLTSLPGTPTNVAGSRVSDTQVNLTWAQSSPSNGQPTTNDIITSINGAAFGPQTTINPSTSASLGAAANQKMVYRVRGYNAAGHSAFSTSSAPVFTTPGAPSSVTATKNANLGIAVAFTSNVAYNEHTHEVWHGVVANGVTTWDSAVLATLAAGTKTYTHASPEASQVHIYRVRSSGGGLLSKYATSNSVQLLVAPNKPTAPAIPSIADKALALVYKWVHNSIDTTPQTGYEFSSSVDNGTTWTTTGRVASTASTVTVAANTHAANVALTTRVRTWGSATTGGAESTGASPWSDLRTVTFKSIPTATITSPVDASTVNDASVRVTVGFAQAENATFVRATVQLLRGTTLLEEVKSNIQVGIALVTQLTNGTSYTIRTRVLDSNGLSSVAWVSSNFSVTYLAPVIPEVKLSYLEDTGYTQIDLVIPTPRTNTAPNPAFELDSGVFTVRTNLATNPNAVASAGFFPNNSTIWSVTHNVAITDHPKGIKTAARSNMAAGHASTPSVLSMYNVDNLGSTGSPARYEGCWVWSSAPGYKAQMSTSGPFTELTAQTWTFITDPTQIAAGSNSFALVTKVSGLVTDDTDYALITGAVALSISAPAESLSGDQPAAGDYTYAWTGAVNNSTSVQRALGVAGTEASLSANVQSSEWSVSGTKSLRVVSLDPQKNAFSYVKNPNLVSSGELVPGKSYTLMATMRLAAPLKSPGSNTAMYYRSIMIAGSDASVGFKNVAGIQEVRMMFTVPLGETFGNLRLYNPTGPNSGDTWFDNVLLVEGSYTGPWFAGGQSNAESVTITRSIDKVTEVVVQNYPAADVLTFLDTTPTTHGTNLYTVTSNSSLNAKASIESSITTAECRKAFLSKDPGFGTVVAFGGNLDISESLSVASDTIQAAGRTKPVGLYGIEASVQMKITSLIFPKFGSTLDQIRALLLMPGKACYRDSSGKRVFGSVKGSLSYTRNDQGELSFTITETS